MSSFEATCRFHGAFFLVKFVILLHLLKVAKTQVQSPTPQISTSVAKYICDQQNLFQETGKIQSPLKSRPQNDDSKCGWYFWEKCGLNSESCPSFDLKTCQETEMGRKKGKGVAKQGPRDPCFNSTAQGLPNPEIVGSMSKYPSVVTIEIGEICQVKECAGLILDKNWIIVQQTDCFKNYKRNHSDYFVIVAGERRMHVEEGTEQRRNVAEYIPHPGLEFGNFTAKALKYYKNDIGLVRVSTPFEFNSNVQPIDLAAIEAVAPSIEKSSLKIVGWIMAQPMKEEEELLASLMESPLDFVPTDKCFGNGEMDGGEMEAPNTTLICCGKCLVHGDEKNQPRRSILYTQKEGSGSNSTPVPVGLGPLKFKGGKPQFGVFLKLAAYIPWIKETAKSGSQSEGETTTEGPELEPRIKRGEDAPPYKYKSLGNLEASKSYACTAHNCGGLILNEEWFLTAAHCLVLDPLPEHYRVIVGDHDISGNDENEQILGVSKIIIHENWDCTKNLNDIALIKVTPPFQFNDRVQPVTLPNPSFEASVLKPLTAAGWGQNSEFFQPHILQQVQLPFVPLDECQKFYPAQTLVEGDMCAGNSTHGIGKGDSGGPLYDVSESGEQIVVGIVSRVGVKGIGSEKSELNEMSSQDDSQNGGLGDKEVQPGLFTKVSHYIDWIKKNAEMSA